MLENDCNREWSSMGMMGPLLSFLYLVIMIILFA